MEQVKIEIVCKGIVKPSSPTPPDLTHYQLSFLDQMSPHVYTSLVLFYNTSSVESSSTSVLLSRLKTSLSETLTLFYPLAGRHKGNNTFIDCNDHGVPFIETRVVNSRLSDVVRNPDPLGLRKFVPFVLDDLSDVILGVQFNVFEDGGGIAIGLCISHRIADGLSMLMFTKTWAAICRGDHATKPPPPEFVSAKLFPPITELEAVQPINNTTKKIFSRRFVFTSDATEALKAKYSSASPSRVGVLSAFIWSRIAAATQVHSDPAKACIMTQMVNLRTRSSEPPLPEHSFGNLYRVVLTMYASPDVEGSDYVDLIAKMREATRKIDAEYLRKLSKGEDQVYFMMKRMASQYDEGDHNFNVNVINFTSLCRFPLYESDFGWGKPTWVGIPPFPFDNLVVFADTKSGDGIEAYVNWNEEDMVKLEKDEEFQTRISPL